MTRKNLNLTARTTSFALALQAVAVFVLHQALQFA